MFSKAVSLLKRLKRKRLEREALDHCCHNIQWLLNSVAVDGRKVDISGWAIYTKAEQVGDVRFLLNDREFDEIDYPISSPDLSEVYWNSPTAGNARFHCTTIVDTDPFENGFACFEFVQDGDTGLSKRTAWYLPDPDLPVAVPEGKRIARVIGVADDTSYSIGGASIYKRIEHYLKLKFSAGYGDFGPVLDWGCGSGRVTRYFQMSGVPEFWGADIDRDNIEWCQRNMPSGNFQTIPLAPPTGLPSNHFGLIIGISVLTHLDEQSQFRWLEELQRIAKPGALLLLSVQGKAQSGLYRNSEALLEKVRAQGFVISGSNKDLDDVLGKNDHYLDVIHSRDYIADNWSRYFTVVDFLDATAANQDLVVLMKAED